MKAASPRLLLPLFAAALMAGCDKDEIRTYSAPRDDDPGSGPARVLAAIVPVGNDTWVLKMGGRDDILSTQRASFKELIDSLKFPKVKDPKKDESLAWKVPKDWEQERNNDPKKMDRVATLKPRGAPGPELTITRLPAAAAALKPNVDRWRRNDLGLPPISPRALEKVVERKTIAGHEVTLVDLRGPGSTGPRRMGGMPAGHPPARPQGPSKLPFTYTAPPGWEEGGQASFVVASLVVRDGGEEGKLTVSRLAKGMPGGMLANVNRWRNELRLPPLEAGDLDRLPVKSLRVDGTDAKELGLEGSQRGLRVAWFERGDSTWFFKLAGPPRLVAAQRGNFDRFMKSIRFTGGADE